MRIRPTLLLATAALAVGLTACSTEAPAEQPSSGSAGQSATGSAQASGELPETVTAALSAQGVTATDVRTAITELDRLDQARPLDVQASVRPDQVVFTADGQEVAVPVPGDEVYVSIAPYVEKTHECFYHALGGCQGEMTGEDVHVTITAEDGTVLVDEDATTYANGFVGYWLPKDTTGTISITQGEMTGEVPLDTGAEGPTCVATLQLA